MKHSKLPWMVVDDEETYDIRSSDKSDYIEGGYDWPALNLCKENADFIVEACNNYERLQAENKAWETNYTNLQAEYEEMASIAYSKTEELERLKNRIDKLSEELRTEQALRGE